MITFATVALAPGGFIAWIVAGLLAGWLTGMMMGSGGYGFIGDLVLGLIGAIVGGFLTGFFVEGAVGFWGTIAVAFIAQLPALVAVTRALGFGGRRTI